MDCHKDIGQDVRAKAGYHGRLKPQNCRSCHTDHKGRGARIVELDKKQFDHNQTDFALRGGHQKPTARSTTSQRRSTAGPRRTATPATARDDVPKGSLGPARRLPHRQQLEGSQSSTTRRRVSRSRANTSTPSAATATEQGRLQGRGAHLRRLPPGTTTATKPQRASSARSASCHNAKAWKPSTFNHDVDTKYVLRGKHRNASAPTATAATSTRSRPAGLQLCHEKDDKHKGSSGMRRLPHRARLEGKGKFDHDKTSFPLLASTTTKCDACHKTKDYKEAPMTATAATKDDKHEGTLGEVRELPRREGTGRPPAAASTTTRPSSRCAATTQAEKVPLQRLPQGT